MSQSIEETTERVQKAGKFVPLLTNEIKKVIVGQGLSYRTTHIGSNNR